VVWSRGDAATLEKLVGYRIRRKPYVGKRIGILAGHMHSLK